MMSRVVGLLPFPSTLMPEVDPSEQHTQPKGECQGLFRLTLLSSGLFRLVSEAMEGLEPERPTQCLEDIILTQNAALRLVIKDPALCEKLIAHADAGMAIPSEERRRRLQEMLEGHGIDPSLPM